MQEIEFPGFSHRQFILSQKAAGFYGLRCYSREHQQVHTRTPKAINHWKFIICRFGLACHQCKDDNQLCFAVHQREAVEIMKKLVLVWLWANKLKHNKPTIWKCFW